MLWANTRLGFWRVANSPVLRRTLSLELFKHSRYLRDISVFRNVICQQMCKPWNRRVPNGMLGGVGGRLLYVTSQYP